LSLGPRHLTKSSWRKLSSCFACWIKIGYRCHRTDVIIVLIKAPTTRTRNFTVADPSSFPCRQISSRKKRAASMSNYMFGNKCASILRWFRTRISASPLCRSIICWTALPNKSASETNWQNTCRTSINGRLFRGDNTENRATVVCWCWKWCGNFLVNSSLQSHCSITFVLRYSLEIDSIGKELIL